MKGGYKMRRWRHDDDINCMLEEFCRRLRLQDLCVTFSCSWPHHPKYERPYDQAASQHLRDDNVSSYYTLVDPGSVMDVKRLSLLMKQSASSKDSMTAHLSISVWYAKYQVLDQYATSHSPLLTLQAFNFKRLKQHQYHSAITLVAFCSGNHTNLHANWSYSRHLPQAPCIFPCVSQFPFRDNSLVHLLPSLPSRDGLQFAVIGARHRYNFSIGIFVQSHCPFASQHHDSNGTLCLQSCYSGIRQGVGNLGDSRVWQHQAYIWFSFC